MISANQIKKKLSFNINPKQNTIYLASSIFVVIVILLSLLNIKTLLVKPEIEVLGATDSTKEELLFWEGFLRENPTYQTGWIELTKLELERGNLEVAKLYFDKAVSIEPNSEVLEVLKDNF
jgi:hypothetical protein